MQIDKQQIIDHLTGKGDQNKADQAKADLPDQVDTEKDSGLLSKLGYSPKELWGKLGGRGN